MTRKANRPKRQREIDPTKAEVDAEIGSQPVNLFGCPDCELLLFEYPDTESVNCPWCRRLIDVHARYSYIAFAKGVMFHSQTLGGKFVVVE